MEHLKLIKKRNTIDSIFHNPPPLLLQILNCLRMSPFKNYPDMLLNYRELVLVGELNQGNGILLFKSNFVKNLYCGGENFIYIINPVGITF